MKEFEELRLACYPSSAMHPTLQLLLRRHVVKHVPKNIHLEVMMLSGVESGGSDRLIRSEVHPRDEYGEQEVRISRYRYSVLPSDKARERDSSGRAGAKDVAANESDSSGGTDSDDPDFSRRGRRKRPRRSRSINVALTIVHRNATPLDLVGQQLWSAAFVLGDYILTHESRFDDKKILELGAGPGLAGLVAARVAHVCYLTDYHDEVLHLLYRNVRANSHLFEHGTYSDEPCYTDGHNSGQHLHQLDRSATRCVLVRRLDWMSMPIQEHESQGGECYEASRARGRIESEELARNASAHATRDAAKCQPYMHQHRASRLDEDIVIGSVCTTADKKRPNVDERAPLDIDHIALSRDGDYSARSTKLEKHSDVKYAVVNTDKSSQRSEGRDEHDKFSWQSGELAQLVGLEKAKAQHHRGCIIIASDVIYDDNLTEAFFSALRHLMPFHRTNGGMEVILIMALEKRFNFTIADMSVVATGYKRFLRHVLVADEHRDGTSDQISSHRDTNVVKEFVGNRISLDFQQCFEYHRSSAMELWEIRRRVPAMETRHGRNSVI